MGDHHSITDKSRSRAAEPAATPIAPGRVPGLGHLIPLLIRPISFLQGLSARAAIVKIYLWRRPVYVLTSPSLVYQTLVTDSEKFVKGLLFDKVRASLGNGLFTSEGDFHLKQRRRLQPAFSSERLRDYTEIMAQRSIDSVSSWQPGDIDIDSELHKLTRTIVVEALFGSVLSPNQDRRLQRVIPAVNRGIAMRALYPVEAIGKLPIVGTRALDAAVVDLRALCDELLEQARDAEAATGLVPLLLATHDNIAQLDHTQIRDEIIAMLLGGTETAATTLSWLCYELALQPELQDRIRSEVAAVTSGKAIRSTDVPRLEYTYKAVEETLRLHTPTWLLMRRTVEPVDFGEVRLPSGSDVLFSLTAMHRLPALYRDPMRFNPERWSSSHHTPRENFLPFSAGKRKCIGDSFAMTEMTVIAATILTQWRIQLAPHARVREKARTTVVPRGLAIRIERKGE